MTRSTPSLFSLFRDLGSRLTGFRFAQFEISFAILAALALILSPHAAFAQRAGGHAGGGGHIGGGGGHFSGGGRSAGFGAGGHSYAGSHVASPIHVFSGPRSAPAAASARGADNSAAANGSGRGAAVELRSSDVSAQSSSGFPRGLGMFAEPGGSGDASLDARRAMPLHTTIGFPPSSLMSGARRGEPLSFSGQGSQMWISQRAAANGNSVRVTQTRPPQRVLPNPPHIIRRPVLGGAPFLTGSPGFVFFNPGFGFFGSGFGCDPFFAPSFGCSGFSPYGFGGFGYLGFGGGYGGYAGGLGGYGYGYDGGYYAPPSFDLTAPNGADEGVSQEPAPSEWQNPPSDNSSVDNSAPAPDTVIFLKDGTSFAVKDYWVADGKLHYVTSYGGENAVDLGAFDLQRTTDENASHGISITLRPAPESQPAPRSP